MDREYKTKIDIEGEKAYLNIGCFIEKIAFQQSKYKNGSIYSLDCSHESMIRTNFKKKTVELTDKVEEWIFNTINELNSKN